ncbi:MAG: Spy/CpxP family protein refolding chaperone [Methylococcaceae bacterium]|jgi:Spy/CpxP family protein refolding chaperone
MQRQRLRALRVLLIGGFLTGLAAQAGEHDRPAWGDPSASMRSRAPDRGDADAGYGHESYGDMVLRQIDVLQLTDEQIGRIFRLHQANQHNIMAIARRLREATQWAHAMYLSPARDEAAIRQASRAHTAAFEELVETALKSRLAITTVLNTEQKARLLAIKPAP